MRPRWMPGPHLPRRWSDPDVMGPAARITIAANRARLAQDRTLEAQSIAIDRLEQQARERARRDLADRIAAWRRGPRR